MRDRFFFGSVESPGNTAAAFSAGVCFSVFSVLAALGAELVAAEVEAGVANCDAAAAAVKNNIYKIIITSNITRNSLIL